MRQEIVNGSAGQSNMPEVRPRHFISAAMATAQEHIAGVSSIPRVRRDAMIDAIRGTFSAHRFVRQTAAIFGGCGCCVKSFARAHASRCEGGLWHPLGTALLRRKVETSFPTSRLQCWHARPERGGDQATEIRVHGHALQRRCATDRVV